MMETRSDNPHKEEIQPYLGLVCYFCHKKSACLANLTLHMRIHTKEAPFFCKTCPKGFSGNADLRRHKIVHLSRQQKEKLKTHFKYNCNFCGKKFIAQGE